VLIECDRVANQEAGRSWRAGTGSRSRGRSRSRSRSRGRSRGRGRSRSRSRSRQREQVIAFSQKEVDSSKTRD